MTIAVCYLSPEGVVLGADSTTSLASSGVFHYFNNNQKVFEIGQNATLGIATWGLGGLFSTSYRTLIALLADDLEKNPPATVDDVAQRWSGMFWDAYSKSPFQPHIAHCKALSAKTPFDPGNPEAMGARSKDEEEQFRQLSNNLVVGFCIAGYLNAPSAGATARTPKAFEIVFDPLLANAPTPAPVMGSRFWGAPNIIDRLIGGCDANFRSAILGSGKWSGSDADFDALMTQQRLYHGILPIRDAIDFVHACIYTTIKAMKFSSFNQICGGPIELAVITTDRRFRWVRHKEWDAAILEGAPS